MWVQGESGDGGEGGRTLTQHPTSALSHTLTLTLTLQGPPTLTPAHSRLATDTEGSEVGDIIRMLMLN